MFVRNLLKCVILQILDTCDIVVDVGGVYDPKIQRYDHHQRSFEHTLSSVRPDIAKNKTIKYVHTACILV